MCNSSGRPVAWSRSNGMVRLLLGLFVLVALAEFACGHGGARYERSISPTPTPTEAMGRQAPDLTLSELQMFAAFPVYWLGPEYGPYPLTRAIRSVFTPGPGSPSKAENLVLLIYGECTPAREEGCSPPLALRVEPVCDSRPGSVRTDGPDFEIRGATAAHVADHIRIWTRDVTISVFGSSDQAMLEAAQRLTVANGANFAGTPVSPDEPFRPFNGEC